MIQRAYTLRLDNKAKGENSWRQHLWTTHVKVNAGARAFGDFLLTLRGGMPASISQPNKKTITRRMLALCWFSVESEAPETSGWRVPTLNGPKGRRADESAMRQALEECLRAKGVTDISKWTEDCLPSLTATIRDDAVWVQRWRMFGELPQRPDAEDVGPLFNQLLGEGWAAASDEGAEGKTPDDGASQKIIKAARSLFGAWLGEGKKTDFSELETSYQGLHRLAETLASSRTLTLPLIKKEVLAFLGDTCVDVKRKKGIAVDPRFRNPGPSKGKQAKESWQKALFLLRVHLKEDDIDPKADVLLDKVYWEKIERSANRWLEGKKASSPQKKRASASWHSLLKERIERQSGMRVGANSGGKVNTEFARLMLAAAAVRLSQTQSWTKRKELERHEAETTVQEKAARFKPGGDAEAARRWLDDFLERRARNSGALDAATISKNALDGWKSVIKRWKACATTEERLQAIREAQDQEEKFGDAALFQALAEDAAACVWKPDGEKMDPSILTDFHAYQRAQSYARRHKVPSFRHPDPFFHPVFCEFGESRPPVHYGWQGNPQDRLQWHDLKLLLLQEEGQALEQSLRWRCDRLNRELGLGNGTAGRVSRLTRNTRLGRQAVGQFPNGRLDDVVPPSLLSQQKFNARLQVDRGDLARLGKRFNGDAEKARQKALGLRWFVTFSPKLDPAGPWLDFAATPEISPILKQEGSPVWHSKRDEKWIVNRKTGWLVRPGLGILPGIRVLGVDLGHRYGAIGAVWQQVSAQEVCQAAGKAPDPDAVSLRCEDLSRKPCRRGRGKGRHPELVFRRLGEESWARLERQFVIRLPGEMDDTRKLNNWERNWLAKFTKDMGCKETFAETADIVATRVELLHRAQQALVRHGDHIRIFHYLAADKIPGMGGEPQDIQTPRQRVPFVEKALRLWERLAASPFWAETSARRLWDAWVVPREAGLKIEEEGEDSSAEGRKAKRKSLYHAVAESLANDAAALEGISKAFLDLWRKDEESWPRWLGALSSWIVRGKRLDNGRWVKNNNAQAGVGALSLDRIKSLELLARLQRAYAQRPSEATLWKESLPGDRHGRAARAKLERLREDRLKKLANAIAMAALGLVAKDPAKKKGNDKGRRLEHGRHDGPRFAPVHAVAIENLERYRPEVSRTRRENRGLMSWSAGELARRLGDACELHSLLLLQVQPNYTSRFCSRCGAPGVRCEQVSAAHLKKHPYWKKALNKARAEKPEKRTVLQARLLELAETNSSSSNRPAVLPRNGGSLFVCSAGCSGEGWVQADLNAAANIGLRAMVDGRWPDSWQYVPTRNGKADSGSGSLKGMPESLKNVALASQGSKREDATYNSFRDLSRKGVLVGSMWEPYKSFFARAEDAVVRRLATCDSDHASREKNP